MMRLSRRSATLGLLGCALAPALARGTEAGAACRLDAGRYEKGIKVSDAEMAGLSIQPANFHGEWNYTITPRRHGR